MKELLSLFINNILPIFLAAGSGFLLGKLLGVNPRPVSKVAFYIFSPCLLFTLLTASQLNGEDILRMAGFAVVSLSLLGVLSWMVGKALRFERRLLVAVLLTTMFNNSGNYGLSLNLFAFGENALAHASVYFVTMAILVYTVGVVIASLGSSNLTQAFLGLFKVPALYAVALALLFLQFGWQLPLPLERTVSLLGDAAIPLLMVLMGVQLSEARWNGQALALTTSNVLRLVGGPAIGLALSVVFGLQGAARLAGISQSAMPTAVVTTVLATEFNVEPSFVSTMVFVSTLLSPLTVTPLLAYLGA